MSPPDFQPTLIGPSITVRPVSKDDWSGMFAAGSDPEIWKVHPVPDRYTEAGFRKFFDGAVDSRMELELSMASQNSSNIEQLDGIGSRSELTCPECGGALWEMQDPPPRFRCHVGHAYGMRSLVSAQSERVESALWAGLRSLEESEALARRLGAWARRLGHDFSANQYAERADEDGRHAEVLRQMLQTMPREASDVAAGGSSTEEAVRGSILPPEGK